MEGSLDHKRVKKMIFTSTESIPANTKLEYLMETLKFLSSSEFLYPMHLKCPIL